MMFQAAKVKEAGLLRNTVQALRQSTWKSAIGIGTICLVLCLALSPVTARAQAGNADVLGTVTDATGAVIPGATVTIHNLGTGIDRVVTTSAKGDYTASLLPDGHYSLKVAAKGFKTYTVATFPLIPEDRLRMDAQLSPGAVTEIVNVEATAAETLQTDSSTITSTIDEKATQDLPLNNRSIVGALALMPGVMISSSTGSSFSVADRRPSENVNVNGQQPQYNNNLIDGFDNNERNNGISGVRPSIDGIAEMQVDTSVFRAEVGRAGGGAINLITKSGGNKFHGSAFEFLRNEDMDAEGFFANSRPIDRQNTFGGSIGGPIWKNKTFFFFDYEQYIKVQGQSALVSLPTLFEEQNPGNFSDISVCYTSAGGPPPPPGAPPAPGPGPGTVLSTSTPLNLTSAWINGNETPYGSPEPMNSIAENLWSLIPAPNRTPTSTTENCTYNNVTTTLTNVTPTSNYFSANPITQHSKTWDLRIDHHFNDSNTLFARYANNPVYSYYPGYFPEVTAAAISAGVYTSAATPYIGLFPGGNNNNFPGPSNTNSQNFQLDFVHIFNPNLILDLKAGFSRVSVITEPLNYGIGAAAKLGIPGVFLPGNATTDTLPIWDLGTFQLGASNSVPDVAVGNNFQYAGSLSYIRGNHTFKFGAGLIRRQLEDFTNQEGGGGFPENGNSYPDTNFGQFLTGFSTVELRSVDLIPPHFETWEEGYYGQDDWRFNSKLTLNLGLRYDIFTPWTEAHGYQANFDMSNFNYILGAKNPAVDCNTCEISPTMGVTTKYNDVSPRLGFAYSITPKTVLRGGYGMSYYPLEVGTSSGGTSPSGMIALPNAPYVFNFAYTPGSQNYVAPYWGAGPIVPSLTSVNTVSPSACPTDSFVCNVQVNSINVRKPNSRAITVQQINLMLQRQIGDYSITAGYVGVLSNDLGRALNLNQPDPPGANQPTPAWLYQTQLPNVQALGTTYNGGYGSYTALDVIVSRQFKRGLSLSANYVWAHALDDIYPGASTIVASNPHYDYGSSADDIRNRIVANGSYTLPFASSSKGIERLLAKGWTTNLLFNWSNAAPYEVDDSVGGGQSVTAEVPGISYDRPDIIGNPYISHPSHIQIAQGKPWFNAAAFALQTVGTAGDEHKNAIKGAPNSTDFDASLLKDFAFTENMKFQFRAEAYNIFNHTNFGGPGNNISPQQAQTMGVISSTTGNPRQMQLALKFLF